jgi:hypothetical protein
LRVSERDGEVADLQRGRFSFAVSFRDLRQGVDRHDQVCLRYLSRLPSREEWNAAHFNPSAFPPLDVKGQTA